VLHPVAGRPMVLRVLDAVCAVRPLPEPVVVVVGHGAEQVQAALADAPLTVRIAMQSIQLGTGHAVGQAEAEAAGRCDTVLVLYGDTPLLTAGTLLRLIADHSAEDATVTLITTRVADPEGYGRVLRGADGSVSRIVEHRDATESERAVDEINAGMYAFRDAWLWPALRSLRPSSSGELYLTDLVERALAEGRGVRATVVEPPSEVLGVNTPDELALADRLFRERTALAAAGRADPALEAM
jgi:bifunctional UDP-N-acetylglucosamine pyrophosphorylase/glucosamine-1-phosphate N-acetyltransferase